MRQFWSFVLILIRRTFSSERSWLDGSLKESNVPRVFLHTASLILLKWCFLSGIIQKWMESCYSDTRWQYNTTTDGRSRFTCFPQYKENQKIRGALVIMDRPSIHFVYHLSINGHRRGGGLHTPMHIRTIQK